MHHMGSCVYAQVHGDFAKEPRMVPKDALKKKIIKMIAFWFDGFGCEKVGLLHRMMLYHNMRLMESP